MAVWGKVEFSELTALRDRLERLQKTDFDAISEYLLCLLVMTFPSEKPAYSRLPFLTVSRVST